ncbi:hypothetical protein COCCADRAFT_102102 [Bipolaris zeicola 26-R-13]|uniref:Uncharacterized protein n=1 Tax=Cochliobolus carbonum (strain 26-R-13) TaxID=930089 RepID=W6Y0P9_COCC2|nr:uncharacterized protein COCCADRAFT_102102 [Bipolaris zeicola 26-R-13]EUC31145.1 hypothetical protein COCCADRAFT_102102 [Bipolaris zeicola 26-R-13]
MITAACSICASLQGLFPCVVRWCCSGTESETLVSWSCPMGISASPRYQAPAIDARSRSPGRHAQVVKITPFWMHPCTNP